MDETTHEVHEWINSFDANLKEIERVAFTNNWDFQNWVRELAWHDPDFRWDIDAVNWAELQEKVRANVRIDGETASEFLHMLFETELCAECFGDTEDHIAEPDMLGKWHAWCTYNAPRMMQFVTTINPARGNERPVRLEEIDTGKIVAEVSKSPVDRNYPRQRGTYRSAWTILDESLRVAAQEMLSAYRKKKHNES